MAVLSQIKASDNVNYNIRDDYSTWGGRNLLLGSFRLSPAANISGWILNGASMIRIITVNNAPAIHFSQTLSNSTMIPSITTRNICLLDWDSVYIYSMELKCDKDWKVNGASVPQHYWVGSSDGNLYNTSINNGKGVSITSYTPANGTNLTANTWYKFERIITTAASAPDSSLPYPAIRPFVYGSCLTSATTGEVNMWCRNVKIEKGNKPTDWSPAPEDIARFIGNETIELYG